MAFKQLRLPVADSGRLPEPWLEQSPEVERIKQEYASQLSSLSPEVSQYMNKYVQALCRTVCSEANSMSIDELSEKVQKFYQNLSKCMDAHNINQGTSFMSSLDHSLLLLTIV